MKILFFIPFVIISYTGSAQKKQPKENLDVWKKAVINVETEGDVYPTHFIDSVIKSKKDSGYDNHDLDSISKLYLITVSETGTAIYIRYGNRKYLITAKHVLSNKVFISQKTFETINKINKWDTLEAIYPRISVRTPFEYFISNKAVNNFSVITKSSDRC
jgi:hypothetical protein